MKKPMNYWIITTIVVIMMGFIACNDDEEDPEPQQLKRTYTMSSVSDQNITGEVTFTKLDASSTLVSIDLVGTSSGSTHPAHIHSNSASEGGGVVVSLTSVDGATGKSETTVTQMNDGTPITYEGLLAFDGHVNVHLSPTEISTLIARGDIGSNATGSNNGGNGGNGGY